MSIALRPAVIPRPSRATGAPARVAAKVASYEMSNVARSRWLIGYALFFLLATDALLRFGGADGRALLSLSGIVLFVIPLVGLVFGTTYLHDAREFTELLLAQPVGRGRLYAGLFVGLTLPLCTAFVAGVAIPFAWHGIGGVAELGTLLLLLGTGALLTSTFVGLAFVVALLADHPIERPLLGVMLANPIDLARVLLLMRFDAGAVQGYTGAVFARFFGGAAGSALAAGTLLLWAALPAAVGLRAFRRRDF